MIRNAGAGCQCAENPLHKVWIVVPCIGVLSILAAVGLKSNAEGVSLGVKSVQ